MASYRYTRDIPTADLKPGAPASYSQKQRAANWWHYHWGWVVGGLAAALFCAYFIFEAVTTPLPDLTVGVVAPYTLPSELLTKLEEGLAPLVGDVNGDGKTMVEVQSFTLEAPGAYEGTALNPTLQMASATRLSAALQTGDVVVFIVDAAAAGHYREIYGLEVFSPEGGAPPAFGAIPALAAINLELKLADGSTADGQGLFKNYLTGLYPPTAKPFEGQVKTLAAWLAAKQFLNYLNGI